eukprot:6489670-Amphidinium_carterae.1
MDPFTSCLNSSRLPRGVPYSYRRANAKVDSMRTPGHDSKRSYNATKQATERAANSPLKSIPIPEGINSLRTISWTSYTHGAGMVTNATRG